MSATVLPIKTALGREELSRRVHGLSQRHRTVLLLVDGGRPLSMVLSLAQKAGASVQHFEELVRLGLVELPQLPTLQAEAPPDSLFDSTSGSHAEIDLESAPEAGAPAALPEAVAQEAEQEAVQDTAQNTVQEVVQEVAQEAVQDVAHEAVPPSDPQPVLEAAAPQGEPTLPPDEPVMRAVPAHADHLPLLVSVAEPMPVIEVDIAPPPLEARRPEPRAPRLVGEELVVHEVRELLLAAIEALPPRHRLHKRLLNAATSNELVDVIEMVERLVRRQGGATANAKLMSDMLFARDLLGLGNTRFVDVETVDGSRRH